MRFFTSDPHYFHKNVINYCNRPWDSLEAMHEGLIENWNSVVGKNDECWVLGDFCFGGLERSTSILKQLNGTKYLVEGNHDWQNNKNPDRYFKVGFSKVYQIKMVKIQGHYFMMSHFPLYPSVYRRLINKLKGVKLRYLERRLADHGQRLLHGHVHTLWKKNGRQLNLGVDVWGGYPVSEQQILDQFGLEPK